MFESRISAGTTEKNSMLGKYSSLRGPTTWKVTKKCVNDIVSWQTGRLNNSTKYQLHALMTIISRKRLWENCQKCSQIGNAVLGTRKTCLWSVNKFARSITKWTKACDKRLCRLISYIHHTCEYKQYCHVENTAKQCRLGLFQDPILQEILRIQNLHQVEHCAFSEAIRLFQSVGCVRNKLQFRTIQQNQKSCHWMQNWGWMVSPHLIYGI